MIRPGVLFNDRYRLDELVGEGGMATVYRGTDVLLRRRVAIKVLRPQYAADAEFVRRFHQEAEAAARLTHPNIVATYDMGRQDDLYYIVMELVDGSSLAEILAHDGRLPEPVAIEYATQMCNGLAYAHRHGILHRDVKPANILVGKDDIVKLSDFGIARAVSERTMALTRPGLVMGSVYYMSPEQAQGHELHETADLYSLGVVLFQMLTGRLPYTGESPVTVALKHVSDPVPVIDPATEGVSPAVAAIVETLLQKHPDDRFRSAAEVAAALRQARERPEEPLHPVRNDGGVPPPPPRPSPLPDRPQGRATIRSGRFRRWGVAIPSAVLLAAATAFGYWLFARPLPNLGATVTVEDYRGMTDVQAQQRIVNAGLSVRFLHTYSDTVPADHIIRQEPPPGTRVARNALVELIVSNGLPLVGLPDVRGYYLRDAERDLHANHFAVRVVQRYDAAPKDSVIDQRPRPGAKVRRDSTITLIVSAGPRPVLVPRLIGLTVQQAEALAARDGFGLDASQTQTILGVPAGTVASQDVSPGQRIPNGSIVHVVVSTGGIVGTAAVPNVEGMPLASALSTLRNAGFAPQVMYAVQSTANGSIIAQMPAAGTTAGLGSQVAITLSVPGEVPDTEGMSVADARATLAAAGYAVGLVRYTTSQGAGGRVVGTQPEAGTNLPPGSAVTLIVNGPPPR